MASTRGVGGGRLRRLEACRRWACAAASAEEATDARALLKLRSENREDNLLRKVQFSTR